MYSIGAMTFLKGRPEHLKKLNEISRKHPQLEKRLFERYLYGKNIEQVSEDIVKENPNVFWRLK